ncbi:hypothetical protein V8E55_005274 [Tylopilus felleus]
MQTFFYYVHYQNDPLSMKIFVAIMWSLNTIHEALTVSGAYKYMMAGLVNPLSFFIGNPELVLLYLMTSVVAIPTQGYFVYRIYLFSDKNIVAPVIWVVLALIPLVCSIMYIAKALYSANGVQVVTLNVLEGDQFVILATLCFSIAAGIDVLIAMFMTFLLIRKRSATRFAGTAHILQRLTVFSVNTGTWTATFALLSVIFLHVFPSSLIYGVFAIPVCPIYCNTLLANLNARAYLRGEETAHDADMDLFSGSGLRVVNTSKGVKQRGQANSVSSAHQGVWKTTEVVTFSDRDGDRSTAAGDQ